MYFIKDKDFAIIFIISSDKEKIILCGQEGDEGKWNVQPIPTVVTKKEIDAKDALNHLKIQDVPKDILYTLIKRSLDDDLSGKVEVML